MKPDEYKKSPWHWAAENKRLEVLEQFWKWSKEIQLDVNDFKTIFSYQNTAKMTQKHTIWIDTAWLGSVAVLEKLLYFVKEIGISPKDFRTMINLKNVSGKTAIDFLKENSNLDDETKSRIINLLEAYSTETQLQMFGEPLLADNLIIRQFNRLLGYYRSSQQQQ